jgi:hypothetical protein
MSNIITSAIDAVKQVVNDNLCPQDIVMERMGTCRECEHLLKLTNTCKKCGCFMLAKTKFTSSKCPLDKWSK